MATSLLLACGLNEHKLPSKIHLSEESDVDGSFLISSILGQRLRAQNSGVILVCLQQVFQHYLNAGIRLGYNMNMFHGKNLHVLEPIQDFGNEDASSFSNRIFAYIKKIVQENLNEKINITILLDNLSILMNLGDSSNSVLKFYRSLNEFVEQQSNEEKSITLITKLNNCDLFDVLDNNLITISDLHIKILKLKSGSFKEVDGKLNITSEKLIGLYGIVKNEKSILYKVNDKNIKIFNPGEIGIKV